MSFAFSRHYHGFTKNRQDFAKHKRRPAKAPLRPRKQATCLPTVAPVLIGNSGIQNHVISRVPIFKLPGEPLLWTHASK